MSPFNKQQAMENAISGLERLVEFGKEMKAKAKGIIPRTHQIIRIHEAVNNNTKRMIIYDATSAGKTYTAAMIKGLVDLKEDKPRKTKALVFAPQIVLKTAWSSDEINKYMQSLGLQPQVIREIDRETVKSGRGFDADMSLINYEKLGYEGDKDRNDYLQYILRHIDEIDMIILDEAHNLKSAHSNRTGAMREIIERTKDKRAIIMSASLIPNKLKDVGVPLYILDPVKYERYAYTDFDYNSDRDAIRNAMLSNAWFYFERKDVQALFGLPELINENVKTEFELSEDAAKEYFEAWSQESSLGEQAPRLRQVLLKSKMGHIVDAIRKAKEKDPKTQVSVFSFLKEGFITELEDKIHNELPNLKTGVIIGDIDNVELRAKEAQKFREGDTDVLISTVQTGGEGISLITHNRPCLVILAEVPICAGEYAQITGRHYRYNQAAPVTILELVAKSKMLANLMESRKHKREMEGVRFRSTWTPTTLDQDRYAARQNKKRQFDEYIRKGLELEGVWEVLANMDEKSTQQSPEEASCIYTSLPIVVQKPHSADEGPNSRFMKKIIRARASIGRGIEHLLKNNIDSLRDGYDDAEWEFTTSADTARMITEIIHSLEERDNAKYNSILDWGCGLACLQRVIGRPIVNLDADLKSLEMGKKAANQGEFVHADMRKSGLPDKKFDIVTSSYALQYNAQGYEYKRDIEQILLETNRVLKDRGYVIFGLPNNSTKKEDVALLVDKFLPKYGFKVVLTDYVKGYAQNGGKSTEVFKGVHIIVAQKGQNVKTLQEGLEDDVIYSPYVKVGTGGRVEQSYSDRQSGKPKEKAKATEFMTESGLDINRAIRSIPNCPHE
ncbi:MAG: SNF2-related protein [Candidatus Woesearchaeota archaeon]